MVSPLSARLLGTSGDSISTSSLGSKKRSISRQGPFRPDSSTSGYSADQEDPSVSPPVVSIDLGGDKRNDVRDHNACPKRRKRNELQFAASSVKADLARAGFEFPSIDLDMAETSKLGEITINLKGVELVKSKDVKGPFVSCNASVNTPSADYEAMAMACRGYYSASLSRANLSQGIVTTTSNQNSSDTRSTSSVSDTDSDSGTSGSVQLTLLTPLLEDSLNNGNKLQQILKEDAACNVVSCGSSAVTMSQILQLSNKARLVLNSSSPHTIVHANAAFIRLTGFAQDSVVGKTFSSLLHLGSNVGCPSLAECLASSSSGVHQKFLLRQDPAAEAFACFVDVVPVVERKTEVSEVTSVSHFAVEFMEDDRELRRPVSPGRSGRDLAFGVMG